MYKGTDVSLNYKKELLLRGWQVGKISMKKQIVHFERTKD